MKKQYTLILFVLLASMYSCNLPSPSGGSPAPWENLSTIPTETTKQEPTSTIVSLPADTPIQSPTLTPELPASLKLGTTYEGEKQYYLENGSYWREDGKLLSDQDYFFPDLNADNPDIQAFLNGFSLPTTPAMTDVEKWQRVRGVWLWLHRNALDTSSPDNVEVKNYLYSLSYNLHPAEFPSIDDLAKVNARYHAAYLDSCTANALALATLLYRFGISPQELAVAQTMYDDPSASHLYVALYISNNWYSIDSVCVGVHTELSDLPENVGCTTADYEHPYALITLPGSSLKKPMVLHSVP